MSSTQADTLPTVNSPVVVSILSFCGLLVVSQLYLSIPLVDLISQVFNVSSQASSWLGSAFGFAYASGFLIFGPLSDLYGRKRVLLLGLGGLAAITFVIGTSPSFAILLQLRIVQGLIASAFAPTALAYISESLPETIRPIGLACMSTGFLLAGILGQIYAIGVSNLYGWRWVFWILSIAYAIAVLLIATQLSTRSGKKNDASLLTVYGNMIALLRHSRLLAAYAATFVLLLSFVAMYSGLSAHLESHFVLDHSSLFFIRLAGIPSMLLSPVFGKFIHKWGDKTVVISGLIVAALGLSIEGSTNNLLILVLASCIFVAGISATVPALISLVGSLAAEARGAAVALYSFVLFVGASFGPLVDAALRSTGFFVTCIVLACCLLSAAVVVEVVIKAHPT